MEKKILTVYKHNHDLVNIDSDTIWEYLQAETIKHYLWLRNDYAPQVNIKAFHTNDFIYLFFKVTEEKISIKHTSFGSNVYKDSCVEFFYNPFPESTTNYFNFEINALGIPLIGVGPKKGSDIKRHRFTEKESQEIEIVSSISIPIIGKYGSDHWTVHCKIPKSFIEAHYQQKLTSQKGIANFYKCGDETAVPHYGAWNKISSKHPNFHLPEYFGEITFSEEYISTL